VPPEMSLAATPTSTADHTVTRLRPTVAAYAALHYGTSPTPMVRIVPDECWPGMWRMVWPDGSQSDMANLARIKDAAAEICDRGPPRRDRRRFRWRTEISSAVLPANASSRATTVESRPGGLSMEQSLPAAPVGDRALPRFESLHKISAEMKPTNQGDLMPTNSQAAP
jgi:hypothetical protein